MSNIIQIDNLNKSFGSVNAVRNLSFRVKKGELFAFLGINGAGKSTTINIMCGQLTKDSGSVVIDKHDLDEDMDYIKRELGVVFQSSVLDSALSVYDKDVYKRQDLRNLHEVCCSGGYHRIFHR